MHDDVFQLVFAKREAGKTWHSGKQFRSNLGWLHVVNWASLQAIYNLVQQADEFVKEFLISHKKVSNVTRLLLTSNSIAASLCISQSIPWCI